MKHLTIQQAIDHLEGKADCQLAYDLIADGSDVLIEQQIPRLQTAMPGIKALARHFAEMCGRPVKVKFTYHDKKGKLIRMHYASGSPKHSAQ